MCRENHEIMTSEVENNVKLRIVSAFGLFPKNSAHDFPPSCCNLYITICRLQLVSVSVSPILLLSSGLLVIFNNILICNTTPWSSCQSIQYFINLESTCNFPWPILVWVRVIPIFVRYLIRALSYSCVILYKQHTVAQRNISFLSCRKIIGRKFVRSITNRIGNRNQCWYEVFLKAHHFLNIAVSYLHYTYLVRQMSTMFLLARYYDLIFRLASPAILRGCSHYLHNHQMGGRGWGGYGGEKWWKMVNFTIVKLDSP